MWNKKKYIMLIMLLLHCVWCSSRQELRRELTSDSRSVSVKSDNSFYVYSDCNIFVKYMTMEDWQKLLGYDVYTRKKTYPYYRIPKLLFFHVIVENRERAPVVIEDIVVEYNNKKHRKLSMNQLAKRTRSAMYKRINFGELLTPRRFFKTEEIDYMVRKIDYSDTVKYLFDFLPPYEKFLFVSAFEWLPVNVKRFKLVFHLKYPGRKKVIDFVFNKSEYRLDDRHFKSKQRKIFVKDDVL